MDHNHEKRRAGGRESIFYDIKASIRQSMNTDIPSLSLEQRKELAASILKLDLKERKEDEINILKMLTEDLDFFVKINSKKINQETKLQEKICRRMKYESFQKGQTVIEYGAKADKFFIILSGQVSIFLVKSQDAIDIEEHQLKTGKKLNAWASGLMNLNDDEELSQKDEVNSPLSSLATSIHRDSINSPNSPFSQQVRRVSAKMQVVVNSKDSPKLNGQLEDKNTMQSNVDQLGGEESPLQLEKILEKSKFSNYNPPFLKSSNASLRMKLNFDEKIQEQVFEEDNVIQKNSEEGDLKSIKIENFQILKRDSLQPRDGLEYKDGNTDAIQERQNSILQKRSIIDTLFVNTNHQSNANNEQLNKLRSASDAPMNLIHHSNSSPLSSSNSRIISKMSMLQQAIKNNAEGASIFKKSIKGETISEMRQRLNTMSNSNEMLSPSSSSLTLSNAESPNKQLSSVRKSTNKNDIFFSFAEEEKNQQLKNQITAATQKSKKTRLGKLIDFYKNYDLFGGELQLSDIENAEKYFTDSGIFKYEYRDKMKPGSTFGELGILEGKPRSALIICSQDSEFAIMEKDDYSELLAERDRKNLLKKFEFLKQKIFPELTNDAIKKIFYSFEKRLIMKNEALFTEGEKANGVFIIKHGEISLSQKQKVESQLNQRDILASDSTMNTSYDSPVLQKRKSLLYKPAKYIQKIFSVISNGEYFGEEDFLIKENKSIRHYTATCSSIEGSVYYIDGNAFMKFIKQKPTSMLVIQKRLNKKLKWRTEHKEKWQEQVKKINPVETPQQIEEAKIKEIISRRAIPKRSSMIELNTNSLSYDIPSFVSPSRRISSINMRNSTISSMINSSSESLSQIPITNRDLASTQNGFQGRQSMNILIEAQLNMDRIWEEKSYDGTPKNSNLTSEKTIPENLIKLQSSNSPTTKMNTENPSRSKHRQQRKSDASLSPLRIKTPKLQHLSSTQIESNSPLNMYRQLSTKNTNSINEFRQIQNSQNLQDLELLRKLSSLSKNNWQSAKKLRQTYSNYENSNLDQKFKLTIYAQTPTQQKSLQNINTLTSLSKLPSKTLINVEQLTSPMQSQTLVKTSSLLLSNSNSPTKKSNHIILNNVDEHSSNHIIQTTSNPKLQGFSQAVQSNLNTSQQQLNQFSTQLDFRREKEFRKLPQISSPEYKNDRPSFKQTMIQELQNAAQQKQKEESKKQDLLRATQFMNYKSFLLKKEILHESALSLHEDPKLKTSNSQNIFGVDMFSTKAFQKRSTSHTDSPQRKKVVNTVKNESMLRVLMRKVKDKNDQIDSILRIDDIQNSQQFSMDLGYRSKDINRFSQDRPSIQETADTQQKKQSLNSLISLGAQTSQERSSFAHLQEDGNQTQIINKRTIQGERSQEKKQINSSLLSIKSQNSQIKSVNQQKLDLYTKLKQNLLQNQSKIIKQTHAKYQQVFKESESPNNFIVSNYSNVRFSTIERD